MFVKIRMTVNRGDFPAGSTPRLPEAMAMRLVEEGAAELVADELSEEEPRFDDPAGEGAPALETAIAGRDRERHVKRAPRR